MSDDETYQGALMIYIILAPKKLLVSEIDTWKWEMVKK